VPASKRDALLSTLAQTHFDASRLYRWRIIALDSDSNVVGRSALYELTTP
jgi:hypothetical protein